MIKTIIAATVLATALMTSCIIVPRMDSDTENLLTSEAKLKGAIAIDTFTSIDVSSAIKVIFTQAPTDSIRYECASKEVASQLHCDLKDGKLQIWRSGLNHGIDECSIYLSSMDLKYIELHSATEFMATDSIKLYALKIDIHSASTLTFDNAIIERLAVNAVSASTVNIRKTESELVNLRSTSASTINMDIAEAKCIDVEAKSASTMNLNLTGCNEIICSARNAGSIILTGTAKKIRKKWHDMTSNIDDDQLVIEEGEQAESQEQPQ